jgi:hypothetical protein
MAKKSAKRGAAIVVLMIAGAIAAGPGTATASAAWVRPVAPPAPAPVVVTVQAPATPPAATIVPALTATLGLNASWAEASWAET